jgi:3-mercaptopyruvate sulfurtransferase SseA
VATDDLAEVLLAEYGARSALAVVCLSGKRSLPVSQRLHEAGLGDVAHLEGGILAWQAAGLPLCGVRSVPEEELVALQGAREFPRAVLSCFVAESVEAQLNAGADSLADPRKLVEEVFDTGPPEDPEHLLHCLDRLAEQARRAGHPLSHIATNVDRLRASLLAVGG